MYRILSWMFCINLFYHAAVNHSIIALCGGIAVLFLLMVAAPFLLSLPIEDDADISDVNKD